MLHGAIAPLGHCSLDSTHRAHELIYMFVVSRRDGALLEVYRKNGYRPHATARSPVLPLGFDS